MFPSLSAAQRQAIAQEGTPTAFIDDESGRPYLLFIVRLSPGVDGSVIAGIPGLGLYGEADAPDEALASLAEAARLLCEI